MKAIQHTLQRISDLTATIESNYPELYVTLEKDQRLLTDKDPPVGLNAYAPYLESLKTLLEEHLQQHKSQKPKQLKNLANEVNYNQEKIQSMVISGKECQKTHLFAFSKGQVLRGYTASEDMVLIMLEGHCSLTLGGLEQQLQPGEIVRIPAHVPHSLLAVTYFKMILLK